MKFEGFKDPSINQKSKTVNDWKINEKFLGFWQEDKTFNGEFGELRYHNFFPATIKDNEVFVDEKNVVVLRSGAGLANCFKEAKPGQLMEITYLGQEKNAKTKRSFHKFQVRLGNNFFKGEVQPDSEAGKFVLDSEDDNDIDWTAEV